MKSYNIYLIRNGLTNENIQGRYIGHTDAELSEDGVQQIKNLVKDMVYPDVDVVISSPLKRCVDTAKIVYPEKEPVIIDDIIECNFGEFENKTADDLKDNETFAAWLAGDPDAVPEYGESNARFSARVCLAFEKIVDGILKSGTDSTAVFTHGGVIMAILEAYGIPELPAHKWLSPCGCGFAVRIDARMWMAGRKFEVYSEFPYEKEEISE